MRSYVIQKQKQIVEMQNNFYTPTGIDGANQVIYFVNTGGFFFMSAELGD